MTKWQVDVKIKKRFKPCVNRPGLKSLIHVVLTSQKAPSPAEVSLVVTDDEDVHRLNKRYGGKDRTTDVLAFALREEKQASSSNTNGGHAFVLPQDGLHRLGEVIISYPQAERQAGENNNSVEDEITTLTVHGLLHLLGYDHTRTAERTRMRLREQRILRILRTEADGKSRSGHSRAGGDAKVTGGESGKTQQHVVGLAPEAGADSSRGQIM